MKGGKWVVALLGVLGEGQVYQTYDFRRPALIRRDVQIDGASGNFHVGFVRPCTIKHGLVYDSGTEDSPTKKAYTDVRLLLDDSKEGSSISSHMELAHRLHWEVSPLNLCMEVFEVNDSENREEPTITISGSFFGHASIAPQEMAWHEAQRLAFHGCEAAFATPSTSLKNSTSRFRFRNLKGNIKSTMGDIIPLKQRDENVVGHQVPSNTPTIFALTSDMLQSIKNDNALSLPWDQLSQVAKSCYTLAFTHNEALPALKSLVKTIYVPQWGDQLKLEETYALINEAAKMTGDYRGSDIHLAMRRMIGTRRSHDFALTGSPILFTFDARIPRSGSDFEYYDTIGNVSTSHVVARRDEYIIELEPRYPVLGSWSFEWTVKYLMPAKLWISNESSRSVLSIPWSATVSGFWSDAVTTEVVLPPRSRVLDVKAPKKDIDWMEVVSTRRWFDLFTKRPVLRMRWSNVPVLSTHKHVLLAQVEYVTDPLTSTLLHLLWFPTMVALVCGLIMIQPLITKFFSFLTRLVEKNASDDKQMQSEPSYFEALIALGDLLRLQFSHSKDDKTRSKAAGTDLYTTRVLQALGPVAEGNLGEDIRNISTRYKEGAQAELANLERRVISRLGEKLED